METGNNAQVYITSNGITFVWMLGAGFTQQFFLSREMLEAILPKWKEELKKDEDMQRAARNNSGIHLLN